MSVTTERVASLVAPLIEDLNADIYDVEQAGGTLRVLLDRPGGVDLELLAEATRRISRALDESDPVSGSYTLEVSSPGLERKLRTADHFRRAVGQRITVKTRQGIDGERRFTGLLESAEGAIATVVLDDGEKRVIDVADVDSARMIFEWGPTPKTGGPKKSADSAHRTKPQNEATS